jgi:hypothetical protein
MKPLKHSHKTVYLFGCILLLAAIAGAQVVRPRKPGEPVTKSSPEPPVRLQPTPELKNLSEAQGIREVKETPGEQDVVISFRARPSLYPVVEISTQRPTRGQGGVLEFSNRLTMATAKTNDSKYEISSTSYTATLSGLESGTQYFYIITARTPGEASKVRQIQGRFTTIQYRLSVKAVFTEIKVTNDSDDSGNGELFFQFFVNSREVSFWGYPGLTLSWNDEEPARQISPSVEYEIADAPETVELAVNGFDDDGPLGVKRGLDPTGPLNAPYQDTYFEANVAKQTFNLKELPREQERHDFTLQSMQQAAGQGDLSFIVKGYLIITREKVR